MSNGYSISGYIASKNWFYNDNFIKDTFPITT